MTRTTNQNGMALIGVIIALMFLTAMAATMATKMRMDTQLRGAYGQAVTGFYAAESGLSQGMGEFKTKFLNYQVPTGSDFSPRSSTMGTRAVAYQLFEKPGNPKSITIPAGQLFAGLNSLEYGYTVTSKAKNNANQDEEAAVGAEFLVGNIPLFQFVAFYNRDLEILPGADMTLRGRVHTNGKLYLNTESGRTFNIEDDQPAGIMTVQVTAKENIHRGRKNNSACDGTVNIDMLEDKVSPFGNLDPRVLNCISSSSNPVPVSTLSLWKGSVVSNIESISVPQPDIISRTGTYWTNAELRIALLLNTPGQLPGGPVLPARIEVQDASGNPDAAKTNLLNTFMLGPNQGSGQYANGAPSSLTGNQGGTRPVFYTDVPVTNYQITGAPVCTCSHANPGCNNTNPSCYPQLNPANTAQYSTTRFIGCPAGTGTCNTGGQALNSNPFDRTYGSNVFTATASFANLPGMMGDLDYRRGGFYNQREDKWMYLLNVNIGDLLQWNRFQPSGSKLFDSADASDGGLIMYLTVVGPSSNTINNYGVRVFGSRNLWFPTNPGAGLDPTGITIVSDQPLYVQGHFNQGNTAASPYGNPTAPAGNLPKQPAAFMADSLNVLSQAYFDRNGCRNDCQSNLALANALRAADPNGTWINAGFLSGVDDTQGSNYNGGLENYPRFHESWTGDSLTYWGSFVSLGVPLHVNGGWCGTGDSCNIYNPPTRSFNYDPFFNNVANLPPLTPRFVYVQQVLFTEDFK